MKSKSTNETKTFPDRANLTPEQSNRLDAWVEQIEKETEGAVKVSKSDLVNFFLENQPAQLELNDVVRAEVKFHSEGRWLTWAQRRLKLAEKSGEAVTLESLLAARKARWAKLKSPAKGVRKLSTGSDSDKPPAATNDNQPTSRSD